VCWLRPWTLQKRLNDYRHGPESSRVGSDRQHFVRLDNVLETDLSHCLFFPKFSWVCAGKIEDRSSIQLVVQHVDLKLQGRLLTCWNCQYVFFCLPLVLSRSWGGENYPHIHPLSTRYTLPTVHSTFLARDVIYTSRAYLTMPIWRTVCARASVISRYPSHC